MYGFGNLEDYEKMEYDEVVRLVATADMLHTKKDINLLEGLAKIVGSMFGAK